MEQIILQGEWTSLPGFLAVIAMMSTFNIILDTQKNKRAEEAEEQDDSIISSRRVVLDLFFDRISVLPVNILLRKWAKT